MTEQTKARKGCALGLWPLSLLLGLAGLRASAVTTNFFEGFESSLAAWSSGDANSVETPAYWEIVDSSFGGQGTHSGGFKAYCAGVGFIGPKTSPWYQNEMTAFLERVIDLNDYTNATLGFWYMVPSLDSGDDEARVLVDGFLIWSRDLPVADWTQINLSLRAFIGGFRTLRFEFSSDSAVAAVAAEGWYLDDIVLTDEHTQEPPPANDHFRDAQRIGNAAGRVFGKNANATPEPDEPSPGNSVWYRWTAPTNGTVTFSTEGSSFDTILCAYTGSALNALFPAGCNDNGGTNGRSRLEFAAIQGQTYQVSVRGSADAIGLILLSWHQPSGANIELLPDLSVWADLSRNYLYGWHFDHSTIPGHRLMRLTTATPNSGAGALELRGSSSSPAVYQRIQLSGGGFTEHFAGTFTFHPDHGHLHFDDWINFQLRAALTNEGVGDIVVSGEKISFAIVDLEVYNLGLPGAPLESKYPSGGLIQGISVGWADVYEANLPDQWIDVTGVPPGRYWLEAVVDPLNKVREANESNNVTGILIELEEPRPPPNNRFVDAIQIGGTTAGLIGSNDGADKEPGELNHGGNSGGASVWYRWTAPANLPVTIIAEGTTFDTLLAVYVGTSIDGLTLVASDRGMGTASQVSLNSDSGTTYHIAVDGYDGHRGAFQLHLNPAWNDDFANAVSVVGPKGSTSGSTRGATSQPGEPAHGGNEATNSIWYDWVAPANRPFAFDTAGSSFDAALAIYQGTDITGLARVGSDAATHGASKVNFMTASGAAYRIAVAGLEGAQGVVRLNWRLSGAPSIVQNPAGTNAQAGSTFSLKVVADGTAPLFFQWRHHGNDLVDNKNLAGVSTDTVTFQNLQPSQMGTYAAVVSNAGGAVTSAPAHVIVLDNPRVVLPGDGQGLTGHIGGVISLPINMTALGDEHALQFSLIYDPTILGNPRVTNGAQATASTLTVTTDQQPLGRLGVALSLPASQTIQPGLVEWARVLFDAVDGLTNGTTTGLGFGDQPTGRRVDGTNATALTTLFVADTLTLEAVDANAHLTAFPNGEIVISLHGIAGRTYVIEASSNLTTWMPVATHQANLDGGLSFTNAGATNRQQFYRGRRE